MLTKVTHSEVRVITEKHDDLPRMKKVRLSLDTFKRSEEDEN